MQEIKVGMIGLDTSHVKIFTRRISEQMAGDFKVIAGYPGGSPDFKASINRVSGFTDELKNGYGVDILDSPEAVAEQSDGIMITSVDGRLHLEQFERVAPFGKPIFIDKPFTVSSKDAYKIADIAKKHGIAVMSASVRRYATALQKALKQGANDAVIGADCYGVLEVTPTQPGWYWYGIHIVETLYAAMGKGCHSVMVTLDQGREVITGHWKDGRFGIARGNPHPNISHGVLLHRENGSEYIDTAADGQEKYFLLLDQVLQMFRDGKTIVDLEETLETIRFIEAANESRITGSLVML